MHPVGKQRLVAVCCPPFTIELDREKSCRPASPFCSDDFYTGPRVLGRGCAIANTFPTQRHRVRTCPKSFTSDRAGCKKKKKKWEGRVGNETASELSIKAKHWPQSAKLPLLPDLICDSPRNEASKALTKPVNKRSSRSMVKTTIVSPFAVRIACETRRPARETIIYPFVGAWTSRPINCRPRNGNFHSAISAASDRRIVGRLHFVANSITSGGYRTWIRERTSSQRRPS